MAPYFPLYEGKRHSGLFFPELLCLETASFSAFGKQGLVELPFISELDNGNYPDDL